jgi:tRNA1Val (adenine37-N6)-methyltransferase
MPNTWFRFKQFTVNQDRCAMKVGTDGVLLGAWVNIDTAKVIFDFGAGTGLLSLMLAQRTTAKITGFEFDKDAAEQANENVRDSPWASRITVVQADLFNCTEPLEKADLIVCNPPFHASHVLPDNQSRKLARHHEMPLKTWFDKAFQWSTDDGEAAFIFPFDRYEELRNDILSAGWHIRNHTEVVSTTGKKPVRSLVRLSKLPVSIETKRLHIENGQRGVYHEDFIEIAKPFYPALLD